VPDRAALAGIVFVLKLGIPWRMLPPEMGCGSGVTCWRRLRDWQAAGVWARLHRRLLSRLAACGRVDWSRASLDSAVVPGVPAPVRHRLPHRAPEGRVEPATGPVPLDRGLWPGSTASVD